MPLCVSDMARVRTRVLPIPKHCQIRAYIIRLSILYSKLIAIPQDFLNRRGSADISKILGSRRMLSLHLWYTFSAPLVRFSGDPATLATIARSWPICLWILLRDQNRLTLASRARCSSGRVDTKPEVVCLKLVRGLKHVRVMYTPFYPTFIYQKWGTQG